MHGMLGEGSSVGQGGGGSKEGLTSQNWGGGAPEYGAGVLFVKDEAHVLEDVGGSSGFELACGRSHRFGKFAPYFVGLGPPGPTTCFSNHRYELHALCLTSGFGVEVVLFEILVAEGWGGRALENGVEHVSAEAAGDGEI